MIHYTSNSDKIPPTIHSAAKILSVVDRKRLKCGRNNIIKVANNPIEGKTIMIISRSDSDEAK